MHGAALDQGCGCTATRARMEQAGRASGQWLCLKKGGQGDNHSTKAATLGLEQIYIWGRNVAARPGLGTLHEGGAVGWASSLVQVS